jgi:tetratricopeptide (TPR) repeat protein
VLIFFKFTMTTIQEHEYEAQFQVGAVVRIPRGTRTGRATISTMDDDEQVNLLWEDAAPHVLHQQGAFIVTPLLPASLDDVEVTVSKSALQHLHPFEKKSSSETKEPSVWKERGDTLLKLGDASSAIPYYERALELTNKVQVGSTVLIPMHTKRNDTVVAAEVDCLDDHTADVTYVLSDEEAVVKLNDIRLAISLKDSELQIRVLLNLARCLLQLAEFDNSPLSRPSLYREGAALACSLANVILLQDDQDATPLLVSTLLLRSKAQAGRARWQAALSDVEQVLQLKPQSKEGRKWRKELLSLIAQHERANKNLVKSMCQWIQTTTNEGEIDAVSEKEAARTIIENVKSTDSYSRIPDWFTAILVLSVSMWIYQFTKS